MPMLIDIAGQRFGRLVALNISHSGPDGQVHWLCICDCGRQKAVSSKSLRKGYTRSCGCLRDTLLQTRSITHGHALNRVYTPTYRSWNGLSQRCKNPNNPAYMNYGGRGITVCERWDTFEQFLADMGERPPGTSIDRIDNDKGYSPDNCRWATPSEQLLNRRPSRNPKPHRPETYARGERSGGAKLTAEQVIAIRADPRTRQKIAEQYGVSRATISWIKTRKGWKHVP